MADRPVRLKNGAVLTPELEEKLRQEAERGYDPAALRRVVRPGRPSRGEEGGESPRVSARVPEDVYRAASERRRARGPRSPTSSASCSLSTPAGAGARADGIAARRPPLRRLGDVVAEHRVVGGNDVGQLVAHDGSERDPSSQDIDPPRAGRSSRPPLDSGREVLLRPGADAADAEERIRVGSTQRQTFAFGSRSTIASRYQ